mgnify:FL=1
MKTKSTLALITALLFTSIGAYAQPMRMDTQTNGRWKANRTQPQPRPQVAQVPQNNRNNHEQWRNQNTQQPTQPKQTNNRGENNANRYGQWQTVNQVQTQAQYGNRDQYNQPHPTRNGYNQRNDGHRVIAGHNERNNGRWQNNTHRATYQRGERLPIDYRGSRGARYEVQNWHNHRNLYAPPRGARWMVSVDGDFILASILTGVIYSVIHS